jgi:hypothetical protein
MSPLCHRIFFLFSVIAFLCVWRGEIKLYFPHFRVNLMFVVSKTHIQPSCEDTYKSKTNHIVNCAIFMDKVLSGVYTPVSLSRFFILMVFL